MPCYHPVQGWFSRKVNKSGKRSVVFRPGDGYGDRPIRLPCGQCIGCRLERSRQWAVRCVHEASLYEENCFLTLTYADKFLPPNGSLVLSDLQLFMKRLRAKFSNRKIRFFACGEYGENLSRPHYHLILFGFDFPDRKLFKKSSSGFNLYESETCGKLWPQGFSILGDVSFESCAYVARYITKKITGPEAVDHYGLRDSEFVVMSRRPGIGKPWLEKFASDVFPSDYVVVRGKKCALPKFYSSSLESDGYDLSRVKARRRVLGKDNWLEGSVFRLPAKEVVSLARLELSMRGYENA